MLSAPQPISTLALSRTSRGRRRLSPTPSEQSYQTIGTHPASLFSVSRADVASDSLSLTTVNTGDLVGNDLWDRSHPPAPPSSFGGAFARAQPPSFLNLPAQRQYPTREKDLFVFLKEAELEHYYAALTTHLKIRSVEQIKYVEDSDLADLGFSRPEQRRLRKYFKRECPQTTMGKLRKRLSRSSGSSRSSSIYRTADASCIEVFGSSCDINKPVASTTSVTSRSRFNVGSWANSGREKMVNRPDESLCRFIPPDQLELGTVLSAGEFCKVYQGMWRPENGGVVQVAIKSVETRHVTGEATAFLNKITILHRLNHPDIVRLYGISMDPDAVRIISEPAPLRSLLECLREPELRFSLPVTVLHKFATQIARAMAYLEEMNIVHRDLAARNVLVFSKDMVKVGDISVSRALQYGSSCYHPKFDLPIAWCAPECIHDSRFTSASDAWAYGVTLWEMFTYGFTPWVGLSGHQILEAIDTPRCARLDQPDACPDAIYDAVMRTCWSHEPEARPTFHQLLGLLPRLCPERWVSTRDYKPNVTDQGSVYEANGIHPRSPHEEGTPIPSLLDRPPLGKQLSVRSKELVYVLAKRNTHFWRVVTHDSHRVGCLPTSILTPYARNASASCGVPDVTVAPDARISSDSVDTTGLSKTLLRAARRASIPDLSFRKTVCRLAKLGSSVSNGTGNDSRLTSEKISLPRSDFRHIGHVGSDGTVFGDLGFDAQTAEGGLSVEEQKPSNSLELEGETFTSGICPESVTSPPSQHNGSSATFPEHGHDTVSYPTTNGVKLDNKVAPSALNRNGHSDGFDGGTEMEIGIMNLNFGTSLLDEVFKCFSLTSTESPNRELHNGDVSSTPEKPLNGKHVDSVNPPQTTPISLMDESTLTNSAPIESSNSPPPLKINLSTASRFSHLNQRFRSKVPSFSPSCSDLSTAVKQSDMCTIRKSRPIARESSTDVAEPPASLSSQPSWKRNAFSSLTRRSASVSKLVTSTNFRNTIGRKGSEPPDEFSQNKRLTISRPILINKPIYSDEPSDVTLSDHRMMPSSRSTAGLNSYDIIDACPPSPTGSNNPPVIQHHSSSTGKPPVDRVFPIPSGPHISKSNGDDSSARLSLSPAPSLSSIPGSTRGDNQTAVCFTQAAGTTGRRLRTLRAGDVVFRASTNANVGNATLNSYRRPHGPSSLSSYTNETRPSVPRLRDLSYSSSTIRSPDYLTNEKGSSGLLSRLDGLCGSNPKNRLPTDGNGGTIEDMDVKPNTVRRLGRCLSVSSSSSSVGLTNRSPGLSPIHSHRTGGYTPSTVLGSPSNSSQSGFTNQMATFWGSTFADLLTFSPADCSNMGLNGTVPLESSLTRTVSSDLTSTLTVPHSRSISRYDMNSDSDDDNDDTPRA